MSGADVKILQNTHLRLGNFRGLNSFYDPKFFQFEEQQIRDLKKFIDAWDSETI